MLETYRPSGRCTAMIVPLALGVTAAGVAVGWVYQLAVDWIPFIYIKGLATFGFAVLLAAAAGIMVKQARCRSMMIALLAAVVMAALVTGATHYFAYLRVLGDEVEVFNESMLPQLREAAREAGVPPEELRELTLSDAMAEVSFVDYVQGRVESGWQMSRRSSTSGSGGGITGGMVWLIWLIEFGILAGGAMLGAAASAKKPYCEGCQAWAQEDLHTVTLGAPDAEQVSRLRGATSMGELFNVPAVPVTGNEALVYKLAGCPGCESAYLTVTHRVVSTNSKGETETKNNDLFTSVVLRPTDVDALHALGVRAEEGELAAAPEAGAAAEAPDSGGAIAVEEAPAESDEYLLDEEELPPDASRRDV